MNFYRAIPCPAFAKMEAESTRLRSKSYIYSPLHGLDTSTRTDKSAVVHTDKSAAVEVPDFASCLVARMAGLHCLLQNPLKLVSHAAFQELAECALSVMLGLYLHRLVRTPTMGTPLAVIPVGRSVANLERVGLLPLKGWPHLPPHSLVLPSWEPISSHLQSTF